MHGMSIDDIQKAEQRLGDDKSVIGDSLQMMSNPQFDYAKGAARGGRAWLDY
jgi:hypothetical protein